MTALSRATVGSVLVALLLLTAGCNGGSTNTTAPPSTTSPAGTTTPGGTTTTPGDAFPEGYSQNGITGDAATLIDGHYATLNDTSYTVDYLVDRQGQGEQGTYQVDHAAGEAYARQVPSGRPAIEAYTGDRGGTVYQAVLEPGNVSYQQGSLSFAAFHSRSRPAIAIQSFEFVNWTYDGTTTENGTELLVYTVSGIDTSERGNIDPARVSNLSGRMAVTREGRIVDLRWSATVDDGSSVVYEYSLSDIGGTTVSEPGWLSEAQEQTG